MRDHLLGLALAAMILFLIWGAFYLPVILWLMFVVVFLLLGIFVRLGRRRPPA